MILYTKKKEKRKSVSLVYGETEIVDRDKNLNASPCGNFIYIIKVLKKKKKLKKKNDGLFASFIQYYTYIYVVY